MVNGVSSELDGSLMLHLSCLTVTFYFSFLERIDSVSLPDYTPTDQVSKTGMKIWNELLSQFYTFLKCNLNEFIYLEHM